MSAARLLGAFGAVALLGLVLLLLGSLVGLLLLGFAFGGWLHLTVAVVRWASASTPERRVQASHGFGSPRYLAVVGLASVVSGLAAIRLASWHGLDDVLSDALAASGASLVVAGWLHGCLAAASNADVRSGPRRAVAAHASLGATLLVLAVAVVGPVLTAIALGYAFELGNGDSWN